MSRVSRISPVPATDPVVRAESRHGIRRTPWFDSRQAGNHLVEREGISLHTILWIIAVILVISGIVTIIRGGMLMGIVLIVVGLLVGPGGVSIFK